MSDALSIGSTSAPAPAGATMREWRAGWPVVLAGFFGNTLVGMGTMSAGTFMVPIESTFGWTRTQFTMGLTAYAIVGIFVAPLIGMLIDRWGARRVAIPGALATGLAFGLFAMLNGSLLYWVALWTLLGIVNQLIQFMVWMSAVAAKFSASRGLALAITMSGSSLASGATPVVANLLIRETGWQAAFIVMGLTWGGIVALIGYLAIGDPPERTRSSKGGGSAGDFGVALRSMAFAKIALATFISFLLALGMIIHLVPLLGANGLSRDAAVATAGAYGLMMILAKIPIGIALDRLNAKMVAAIVWIVLALGYVVLRLAGNSIGLNLVGASLVGFSMGTMITVISYIVSRHFELARFGGLMGIIASISSISFAVGPMLWAIVYDATNSYDVMLTAGIPVFVFALAIILSLERSPDVSQQERAAARSG